MLIATGGGAKSKSCTRSWCRSKRDKEQRGTGGIFIAEANTEAIAEDDYGSDNLH